MKLNTLLTKQTLTVAVALVLSLPQFTYASWYWVPVLTAPQTGYFLEEESPNTIGYLGSDSSYYDGRTITPKGFMDVMDETKKSSKCSGQIDSAISQLRNFDSNKVVQNIDDKCRGECGPYFTQETTVARESLLSKLKSSAEQCLANEKLSIKQAEEERQRKEEEESRLKEIDEEVANCNFDFFYNEMTDKERMETWEQREACKAKNVTKIVSEPVVKPAPSEIPPTQTVQSVQQNPVSTPSLNAPSATQADKIITEPEQTEETATISTISPETVEQSEPQTEEIEVAPILQPEKQTFIQRVIRFFTGWFKS